jgi:hypothetical protein
MDFEEIKKIYNKLEEISVKIEPKTIPNPRYISEKIGQIHVCIEEVEKYYIKVSMEMSVLQRALNNAEAGYYIARDELISSNPEISALPSAQSREARANSMLKDQLDDIKNYKNQLSDLEKIFNTIVLKSKNLNRLNGDIRIQLRLMESQIKLGAGNVGDPVEKNLMNELKNTALGIDILEGADSRSEETSTVDPTQPINPDIFKTDDLLEKKINDVPISAGQEMSILSGTILEDVNNPLISSKDTAIDLDKNLTESLPVTPVDELDQPEDYFNEYVSDFEKSYPEDDLLESIEPSKDETPEVSSTGIDLDKVLSTIQTAPLETGGEKKPEKQINIIESQQKVTPKEEPKNPNEIDFSALLNQFN